MKILLCVVKSNPYFFAPPLGLAYLARYLLREGHEVRIVDTVAVGASMRRDFAKIVKDFQPDVAGFSTYSFSIRATEILAQDTKELFPCATVIFGGPHATYMAAECLALPFVDLVVTAEAEETMVRVVKALSKKQDLEGLPGVWYKDRAGVIHDNGPALLIQNLNAMPFPAYELLDMAAYSPSAQFRISRKRRFGSIVTSRGCPHLCTFCSHKMFGKKMRFRSPENVIGELELLVGKYGVSEILFTDDSLLINHDRIAAICELIIKRNLDIVWSCNCKADYASEKIFALMHKAGCRVIFVGAESGCQDLLDGMKKGITLEDTERAVAWGKRYIGRVLCCFILGAPGDTPAKVRQTVLFAKKLDPDYVTFTPLIPLPGSEVFDEALRRGQIKKGEIRWEQLSIFPPMLPALTFGGIAPSELLKLTKQAYWEFYFRPRPLMNKFRKGIFFSDALQCLKGAQEIFFSNCG